MARFSVKPGYCDRADDGGRRECWLSGRDCDGSWTSGMEMIGTWHDCTLHGTLLEMPLGKCSFSIGSTSTNTCAPNPESCERTIRSDSSTAFTDYSAASSDTPATCWVETTQFGSCGGSNDDGPMCRFSPNDCPSDRNNSWVFPDSSCSCDQVGVGACQSNLEPAAVVCAVDSQACNSALQTWIPVDEVRSTLGVDCFLCRSLKSSGVEEGFASSNNNSGPMPSDETTMNRNVLVGTITGAVVFFALLLVAAVWLRGRRLRQPQDSKTDNAPPASVVMTSSARMMEETSDDISIL